MMPGASDGEFFTFVLIFAIIVIAVYEGVSFLLEFVHLTIG